MRPEVGTVGQRLVVDFKDDIVDLVKIFQIGAEGNVVGDVHDTGVIVGDTDLTLGTAHTMAHITCQRSLSNGDLADLSADLCESGLHTDSYIGRAADNVN